MYGDFLVLWPVPLGVNRPLLGSMAQPESCMDISNQCTSLISQTVNEAVERLDLGGKNWWTNQFFDPDLDTGWILDRYKDRAFRNSPSICVKRNLWLENPSLWFFKNIIKVFLRVPCFFNSFSTSIQCKWILKVHLQQNEVEKFCDAYPLLGTKNKACLHLTFAIVPTLVFEWKLIDCIMF